jgi:tetratricopeptide (TPR) repeat protein
LDHQLAALKIREESLGRTHPQTATTLGSIALIHRDAGEYERARALFDEAVHIHRSVLGDRHQRVAMSLANAATAYARLERASEAKAMQLEALAILEDAVGTDHPLVATVRTDLVATCTLLGEYSQALEHGDRALAILSSLGERHPDRAEALVNLGMVYRGMGKMERAGAHFEQALEIIAEHYGEEHPRAVEVRRLLAELDDEGEPSRG